MRYDAWMSWKCFCGHRVMQHKQPDPESPEFIDASVYSEETPAAWWELWTDCGLCDCPHFTKVIHSLATVRKYPSLRRRLRARVADRTPYVVVPFVIGDQES